MMHFHSYSYTPSSPLPNLSLSPSMETRYEVDCTINVFPCRANRYPCSTVVIDASLDFGTGELGAAPQRRSVNEVDIAPALTS